MDYKLEEKRSVIKFLLLEGENLATFFKGCSFERTGQARGTNLGHEARRGCDPTLMANVNVFVNKHRRMILQEVANQFSIGKASAHQILHEKLGISKVNARWVPKQLIEDQKASRVTIAKGHLGRFNQDDNNYLNCTVTGDKMWVHYAEPKTKAQSEQWT